MAVKNLQFVLSGKDKSASSTFNKVGKSGEGLTDRLGKIGAAVPLAGAAVAGVAAAGIKLGMAFIDTSSRLEALQAKSKTVFGDELGSVQKWAKVNAGAMKLTSSEAVGLSTNMADLLIPMGFTRKAAAKMSTETVGLSGALSKWSGGTVSSAEAADILTDAMLGETDGLKALGISVSAAEVDAKLLAAGQDKLTGSARAQAEAQAVQALIFDKSKDAQAGFAAGGVTLRDRLESVKVKMRETWETLVTKLTPAVERFADWIATEGVEKLQQFGTWLSNNRDNFRDMAETGLRATGAILRGLADLLSGATVVFKGLLDGAVLAFGWVPGLGDKLRGAQTSFNNLRDTAVAGLNAAADKADALASKIASIPDKTINVTLAYGERVAATGRKSDAAEEFILRTAPASRTRAAVSSVTSNVILDGRIVAASTQKVEAARRSRGFTSAG